MDNESTVDSGEQSLATVTDEGKSSTPNLGMSIPWGSFPHSTSSWDDCLGVLRVPFLAKLIDKPIDNVLGHGFATPESHWWLLG